jgi:hypothetical protein
MDEIRTAIRVTPPASVAELARIWNQGGSAALRQHVQTSR